MPSDSPEAYEFVINCDGTSPIADLADTDMSERAVAEHLIRPVAESNLTAIDWNIGTTGRHNCRTRFGLTLSEEEVRRRAHSKARRYDFSPEKADRQFQQSLKPVRLVQYLNSQRQDLLDLVIKQAHAHDLKVFAGVRLNHANDPAYMFEVPGEVHFNGMRKDFRDRAFQAYLLAIYEDLLAKGVDGLTLDFERKAPFFPEQAPQCERDQACADFVRTARSLSDGFMMARVAYDPEKGQPQGQRPNVWLAEGLLDAIVPATHNHEPDYLDWPIASFVDQAGRSPRICRVWPQVWPTARKWSHPGYTDAPDQWHSAEAIRRRVHDLLGQGADGAYFFNFFLWPEGGRVVQPSVRALGQL